MISGRVCKGAIAVLATVLACATHTGSATAAVGDLAFQACIADTPDEGCPVGFQDSLDTASGVAVSPDGTSVYVTSQADDSISHFTRTPGGSLTFAGCVADTNVEGCIVPAQAALDGAIGVTVSPDGSSVYVASFGSDSISRFTRAAGGALTFAGCIADTNAEGCIVPAQAALHGATGVTVSPDGTSVYVTSQISDSISHFNRAANGSLNFLGCDADKNSEGCTVGFQASLNNATGVAVSADGTSAYVASTTDNSISHFTRTPGGSLTFAGCIADTNVEGCIVPAQAALSAASEVAISPDGTSVYVTALTGDSISHFTRAANGSLAFVACIADTNAEGCTVGFQDSLDGASGVAVSPDGSSVYVASQVDDSISHFTRTPGGSLTFAGCIANTNVEGCIVPAQAALNSAFGVAMSPDGSSVYVASFESDSISHFTRELPPVTPPDTTPPDTSPPDTAKGKGPAKNLKTKKKQAKGTFEFSSPDAGASFRCSLDGAEFSPCASPAEAKVKAKRKAKKHSFEVAALDAAGNVDQTPIVFEFRVQRKG